jgi:hypothetical protein
MVLEIYAVHDAAIGAFNAPLFFRSRGEAVRAFQNACGTEANFKAHAKDYSFWLLGSYDDSSGRIVTVEADRVCGASDFIV